MQRGKIREFISIFAKNLLTTSLWERKIVQCTIMGLCIGKSGHLKKKKFSLQGDIITKSPVCQEFFKGAYHR